MLTRKYFQGAGCRLSVLDNDNLGAPPMVLLHGMRDHALAMERIALDFDEHRVIAMDLRGHGASEHASAYTLLQLIADLRALLNHFDLERPVLVGHSLGGQVSWVFSAIYPELVEKLVLIDGLGPPPLSESRTAPLQDRWRQQIDGLLDPGAGRRPLANHAEAQERLLRNNPKLDRTWAQRLVQQGTEPHPDGGLRWRWDPRAGMVFTTFMGQDSEHFYPLIECPVLIVTGDAALDYWAQSRPELAGKQAEYHAASEHRRRLFRNAQQVVIPGAGHMINYDQPDRLNGAIRRFISGHDA
jgi:pimeloyl-ACP methyl ester carboxylesterase